MSNRSDRTVARASSSLLALAVACGDDVGGPPGRDQFASISDSVGETEDGANDGAGDGADDTGPSIPTAVEDYCLFDPMGSFYGYRYQCEGSVSLDFVVEHPFDGSPVMEPFELVYGQDAEGDSYSEPLVMACCPWYANHEPNCGQPHERACWIDVVEQGCKSMIGKFEDYAYDAFPGFFDGAERQAVLKIAEHVRTHQDECFAAFRGETGITSASPSCDDEENGVDFAEMLENGVWSFDPPGAVERVEVSVVAATFTDLFPVEDDEPSPEICWSADENDGTSFLEVDPPSRAKVMHLVSGRASLLGPSADGLGELAAASTLAIMTGPTPSLENLAFHSAGGAAVVAYGMMIPVDAFHLRLWDRTPAVAEGSALTIASGSARFAASATALGESRVRFVTNATPIVVAPDADGWRTSAFEIEQLVGGEVWTVVVAPARWQEER